MYDTLYVTLALICQYFVKEFSIFNREGYWSLFYLIFLNLKNVQSHCLVLASGLLAPGLLFALQNPESPPFDSLCLCEESGGWSGAHCVGSPLPF